MYYKLNHTCRPRKHNERDHYNEIRPKDVNHNDSFVVLQYGDMCALDPFTDFFLLHYFFALKGPSVVLPTGRRAIRQPVRL